MFVKSCDSDPIENEIFSQIKLIVFEQHIESKHDQKGTNEAQHVVVDVVVVSHSKYCQEQGHTANYA